MDTCVPSGSSLASCGLGLWSIQPTIRASRHSPVLLLVCLFNVSRMWTRVNHDFSTTHSARDRFFFFLLKRRRRRCSSLEKKHHMCWCVCDYKGRLKQLTTPSTRMLRTTSTMQTDEAALTVRQGPRTTLLWPLTAPSLFVTPIIFSPSFLLSSQIETGSFSAHECLQKFVK